MLTGHSDGSSNRLFWLAVSNKLTPECTDPCQRGSLIVLYTSEELYSGLLLRIKINK